MIIKRQPQDFEDLEPEDLIDASEIISLMRKHMADVEPHGAYSEHTNNMNAAYKAERLLRWYAGER